MAFVLLDASKEELLGFARFLKVLNYSGNAALFETVVIRRSLRGKGLGKLLMELLKEEAKRRSYELLVLCTEDKELFYEKCGYTRCKFLNLVTKLTAASEKLATSMNFDRPIPIDEIERKKKATNSIVSNLVPLPPPLPPMPENSDKIGSHKNEQYMFCYI